jgi:hypothetical protein
MSRKKKLRSRYLRLETAKNIRNKLIDAMYTCDWYDLQAMYRAAKQMSRRVEQIKES